MAIYGALLFKDYIPTLNVGTFCIHNHGEVVSKYIFFEIQVKLILNCLKALVITCLSHKGQNYVHVRRTTFEVLPPRKQVCRFSFKEHGKSLL